MVLCALKQPEDVDAESTGVEATLPIGVPTINSARPHEAARKGACEAAGS